MKGITMMALAVLAVGIYIEYQKDSSFASVDAGSLLMGGAVGVIVGNAF